MSKLETPAYDKKEVERVDKIIFECELNITEEDKVICSII